MLFPEFEFQCAIHNAVVVVSILVLVGLNVVAQIKFRNVDLFSSPYLPRLLEEPIGDWSLMFVHFALKTLIDGAEDSVFIEVIIVDVE